MTGRLVLMGSGEMAPGLVATHRAAMAAAGAESIAILDTPYGFQENADQLTGKILDFFDLSLGRRGEVASLRLPGAGTLEVETMLSTVRRSRYVFSGPGAPTHALRVWSGTGITDALAEVILGGGAVCFASAAALCLGTRTMPVYQIYKVGDPPHWHRGLGVTDRLGLRMAIVPHWNNREGGTHDTSRCYIGLRRLREMARHLDHGILGIDEHTAITLDFSTGRATVTGVGGVSVIGPHGTHLGEDEPRVESGEGIDIRELGRLLGTGDPPVSVPDAGRESTRDFRAAMDESDAPGVVAALLEFEAASPAGRGAAFRSALVELVGPLERGFRPRAEEVGPFVDLLLETREWLRRDGRYDEADRIRDMLSALGVAVEDHAGGATWGLRDGE